MRQEQRLVILVAGATGFMGSAITRHLLTAGFAVRAMSRSPERALAQLSRSPEARIALGEERLACVGGDVTSEGTLAGAVDGVDAIIQAVQFPNAPMENPARGQTYMRVDRDGTRNMLTAALKAWRTGPAGRDPRPPRFLYLSGVTVRDGGQEPWNQAKREAEEAVRASGLEWTIIRSSWAYGPGDRSLNRLVGYSAYVPFVPTFGDGEERITPVFVEDVGRLFVRAVSNPEQSRNALLELGGPEILTMNQILRAALEVLGRHRFILHVPKSWGRSLGAVLQFLPKRPLTPAAVDFVSQGGVADLTMLKERFPDFETARLVPTLQTYLKATPQ